MYNKHVVISIKRETGFLYSSVSLTFDMLVVVVVAVVVVLLQVMLSHDGNDLGWR